MVSVSPAPPPLGEGHRFGGADGARFLVEKQVGRGGQGLVYRVKDSRLGRLAAAKVCDAKEGPHKQIFLERFERELTLSTRINHPHVLQVFDCGELSTGHPYVLLEFMARGSLADLIQTTRKAGRHLPLNYVQYYATALAAALRAIHAGEIIHRDIKPDNLLVSQDGVAKLTDFGIAKDISPGALILTEVGSTVGTPWYMAPEQLNGMPGPQSDIFSWGVTVYTLITGRPPAQKQVNGFPLGLIDDEAWEVIPRSWRPVLQRATAKRLEDRAQTVDEILSLLPGLRDAADSRPVMAAGELPPLPTSAFQTTPSAVPSVSPEPTVPDDGLGQTMDLTIGGPMSGRQDIGSRVDTSQRPAALGPTRADGRNLPEETLAATPIPSKVDFGSPPSTGMRTRQQLPGEPVGPPDRTAAPSPLVQPPAAAFQVPVSPGPTVAAPVPVPDPVGATRSRTPLIAGVVAVLLVAGVGVFLASRPQAVDPIAVRTALVAFEERAASGDWRGAGQAVATLPDAVRASPMGALIVATDTLLHDEGSAAADIAASAVAAGGEAGARASLVRAAAARLATPPRYDGAAAEYRKTMDCSGSDCGPLVGRAAIGLAETCAVATGAPACKDVLGSFSPRDATMLSALVQNLDGHRTEATNTLSAALDVPLAAAPSCAEARVLRHFSTDPALLPVLRGRLAAALAAGAPPEDQCGSP